MPKFHSDQYFSELEWLVNIDSGSHCLNGIQKVAEFLKGKYAALGMRTNIIQHENAGCCLEARNFAEGKADLLLVGHMDTVFPEGTAAARPYTTDGTCAYGPGVADMKSGSLLISYLIERWAETIPGIKIIVAHNGDEETGSEFSKDWLQELAGQSRYCLVLEPGRPHGEFVKGRRGCVDILLKMHGIASHAGNAPDKGASAILELSHWITELYKLNDLSKGRLVNPGVISGGTAPNVIAEHAECRFDVRFSTVEDVNLIRAKLMELNEHRLVANVEPSWTEIGYCAPMVSTDGSAEIMACLEKAGEKLGISTSFIDVGGSSDANNISEAGTPVLCGCGPCGTNLHSDKEYMVLRTVQERYELIGTAVESLFS